MPNSCLHQHSIRHAHTFEFCCRFMLPRCQVREGLCKAHPEFSTNDAMRLYRCFDASEYEEEDNFTKDVTLNLEAEIDRADAAKLCSNNNEFFQLDKMEGVL